MVYTGRDHVLGPFVLRTESCLTNAKPRTDLDHLKGCALDRYLTVVSAYVGENWNKLLEQLNEKSENQVTDFGMMCHVANKFKHYHPFVCNSKIVCDDPTHVEKDDSTSDFGPSGSLGSPNTADHATGRLSTSAGGPSSAPQTSFPPSLPAREAKASRFQRLKQQFSKKKDDSADPRAKGKQPAR